ncbi:peptide antibiotic transporter SbmA [Methylophaga thalassica]|jgi:peptide/bleomycin uptake transporter|uniref:ABC-type long-chain fatty acid transport system, fused permease and ATPase component n=1 Tax=Methylophaga aminisulfidivorans MP TaxID=1026882 RepID=F5SYB9_9GAMM|nr:peptide antibiotic transporter SbmA [Methylophaga aminisulfidivorans]EGL54164.1 ABC-type long-chain fatty acid transport system, fused permease and ATPase component [Methylophaga aminisulfidivorans MP]
MFKSFFPNSPWFWPSVILWLAFSAFIWVAFGADISAAIGLPVNPDAEQVIGLRHFVTNEFLTFYLFYFVSVAIFAAFWFIKAPSRWQWWSVIGSAVIFFSTYYSVQVSVAINNWRRPFFDAVQNALSPTGGVSVDQLYDLIAIFAEIAFLAVFIFVMTRFLVSHYIFRWRTAMNDYYTEQWGKVRHIEGASQRVQEDTMRFATIMENLGVALIDALMTLFAFLPVLWSLSQYVKELPLVGEIAYPLFVAAIVWSIFGTGLLALVGIKLPGLEFKNQRVEAAYRKELVYGEDDHQRAQPMSLRELFADVRKNYFTLYIHYMYFNVARSMYLQADNIFAYVILVPTIAAGAITFGILQQILTAFSQVSSSFQYLVNSWTTIVELLSVYKRLKSFEASINNEPLPEIDQQVTS